MKIHAIKTKLYQLARYIFFLACFVIILSGADKKVDASDKSAYSQLSQVPADTIKRKSFLEQILKLLPADYIPSGHVSFLDTTFKDWLKRTGEIPPDFDTMPSIPFLPNPLVLDEGGKNIPVTTNQQWQQKRQWMKQALQYYITGTFPSAPDNLQVKVLSEKKVGKTTLRNVELSFGPDHKGRLAVELMIPEGKGPFPVFLTQWNQRGWAQIAVRRGYVGCVYAGADDKDDTEKYAEIWSPKYDFTRLMRRAFGASRAIDYLYTLSIIDREKIGITGHSRNGKQSLWAAAFDERIKAVIPSSGGSGAEGPWRYAVHKYDVEDIALLSCAQPAWLHPRLRFFIGREDKLPVDQNLFMALIAPRGLMLSTAINEIASNPWGIEQAYLSAKKVYNFLGADNNLAIRFRDGLHGTRPGDIEAYIDFFDYIFKRTNRKPANKLLYNYTFENWRKISGENLNPLNYPRKGIKDLLMNDKGETINSVESWEIKKQSIKSQLEWALGKEPSGVTTKGPQKLENGDEGEAYFGNVLNRPEGTQTMGRMAITPYYTFGDYLYGYLYYPKNKEEEIKKGKVKLPVLVYLHEYDYAKGFSSQMYDHDIKPFIEDMVNKGYAVFSYDFIGFGNRIKEGTEFYQRYAHWSKMGKMVADVEGAMETLSSLDFVDSSRIFVAGYSLGATVGLYTAALDKRIAGVVSVCGFTPMRLDTPGKGTEGIKAYSDLHALLPRLGFFVGNEARIPYDFDEILGSIAPRPVLIIAPVMDKDATLKDVQDCVEQSRKIYQLYGKPGNIQIYSPDDYNRFSKEMQEETVRWMQSRSSGN